MRAGGGCGGRGLVTAAVADVSCSVFIGVEVGRY